MPSLMMMTPIVSKESLARYTHTDTYSRADFGLLSGFENKKMYKVILLSIAYRIFRNTRNLLEFTYYLLKDQMFFRRSNGNFWVQYENFHLHGMGSALGKCATAVLMHRTVTQAEPQTAKPDKACSCKISMEQV